MGRLSFLVLVAVPFLGAHAKNEVLIHGWKAEPDGRGTWSILWSCLATIFICTWSVLHLSVPRRHEWWYLLLRKARWMIVTAIALEYMLFLAADNYEDAQYLAKRLKSKGHGDWTSTHIRFAFAGGFHFKYREPNSKRWAPESLETATVSQDITCPPVSADHLKSLGRSDVVVKAIAALQIIWFVLQVIFRAISHYRVTPLEIMTVAFVLCSILIFGFHFQQPQDVEYPIVIEAKSEHVTRPCQIVMRSTAIMESSPFFLLFLFGSAFGGLHCLAWNSDFPTSHERLAWRICSVTTTALPTFTTVLLYVDYLLDGKYGESKMRPEFQLVLPVLVYVSGRNTIIVLAFMSLRALPPSAFETIRWNQYIPHFAS